MAKDDKKVDQSILDDVDARLKLLTLRKLEREEEEIQKALDSAKRQRENGQREIAQKRAAQEFLQSQCRHLKESGKTALGAIRDSNNNYLWICQWCHKEWRNNEVPVHLRLPYNQIGGPEIVSSPITPEEAAMRNNIVVVKSERGFGPRDVVAGLMEADS